MKVIGFSLWGDNPTYNIGAIYNAKSALTMYPDFECWFYIHKESVPPNTVEELRKISNVKIILKEGDLTQIKPMMWRFEPIDDDNVEVLLSRDTDTRILLREKMAVDEWLQTNTLFHIMRDHPCHHHAILGGMFGTKKNPKISSWKDLIENYYQQGHRDYDQHFLRDYIYPIIKDNCTIHASFYADEPQCKPFPISYDEEYHFVGEYVYFDESRNEGHISLLRNMFS
jgi:hypothetical protein